MLTRITDYAIGILLGALIGLAIGAIAGDAFGVAVIGGVVGAFIGVGIRAWRTRDTPESFEDRDLPVWSADD